MFSDAIVSGDIPITRDDVTRACTAVGQMAELLSARKLTFDPWTDGESLNFNTDDGALRVSVYLCDPIVDLFLKGSGDVVLNLEVSSNGELNDGQRSQVRKFLEEQGFEK